MSGLLIGLVNNQTDKIIAVDKHLSKLGIERSAVYVTVKNVLGTVTQIQQIGEKDGERTYMIIYRNEEMLFERFVSSKDYSPLFYRDMKPKFKVGDRIVHPQDYNAVYIIKEITDENYLLKYVYNSPLKDSYVTIDTVNETYVKLDD